MNTQITQTPATNVPRYKKYKDKKDRIYECVKRIFDIVSNVILLVLAALPFIVIGLLIKLEDKGNILYAQERIGKDGKPFKMYKLRTMKMNTDSLENMLTKEEYNFYKKEYKLPHDPRVTRIGKILRKTSLDEIPQIFNVLLGNMSLVGPRPLVLEETYIYGEDRETLLSVKPGITGYWQAYARNSVGYENGKRQEMELYYVKNRSILLDIKILFATVARVISGKGAS